jgi:hypothetical protein
MKKIFFLVLMLPLAQAIFAQTINVSGTVRDKQGDPIHFAFVQDIQYKYATYTDSMGNFAVTANPASALRISCFGYRDSVLRINNNTSFNITLTIAVNINGASAQNNPVAGTNNDIAHRTFEDQVNIGQGTAGGTFDAAQGAIFPVFSQKEATVGSRYLLPKWGHGYVITAKDSLIQSSGFYFNYDKMGGGLLLTKDRNSAIQIDRDLIKSFTLYDDANTLYTFANVPDIDANHYVQVLAAGPRYKIYKLIKTKLKKADYATDGIMATGNNYDEYVNEGDYYVYDVNTKQLQPFFLKKKAIKAVFPKDQDKLNKFMSDHSHDDVDDRYLGSLGAALNE